MTLKITCICGAVNCEHGKEDSIDTLVRDLTKVGSISKSEARRRIEALLEEVIEDIPDRLWHSQLLSSSSLVTTKNKLRAKWLTTQQERFLGEEEK